MTEFPDNAALARRLATLEVPVDVGRVTQRVLSARRTPRGVSSRWRIVAAIPVALVLFSAAASYYAPVFAQALADAPIAGSISGLMLRQFGLAGMPHRVTTFGDTATSAGYKAELVGGYADAGRTILFVRIDPPARVSGRAGDVTLTDQFGQAYFMTGMTSDVATGQNALLFRPIDGLAANLGARLRLVFSSIEEGVLPSSTTLAGHWELTATLAVSEGEDLAVPEAIQLGDARLEFTRVRALPVGVLLEFRLEPVDLESFDRRIPDGLKGRPAFAVTLRDASGREATLLQGSTSGTGADRSRMTMIGSWLWETDGPGRYILSAHWEGVGTGSRVITVP